MATLEALAREARRRHLAIAAGLPDHLCATRDDLPEGTRTLLLLSPDEPAFWPAFARSEECRDRRPDPMDRWSRRVIGDWANDLGATALFPFGGPPFRPFIQWALASGHVHASPVGMLVHPTAGLYLSFRGALALTDAINLPPPQTSPCEGCATRPCLSTCPVTALKPSGYDVDACKRFLRSEAGKDCMSTGCRARRACPCGKSHGRIAAHSAYHMQQFL
ncbi:hypothetical protein OB2597_07725 [Pseudooceanicola batsensis HTCC2597]|uniref:4Fe-4S ferredoxin-type domain-containing protein n=1 Tax=Pseudooceanicola batsensis (strain ATCC BAA-863 / DSM 15984 / KCTC 12145 / HTCC2597) TaxID=252305 RepID=A3TU30_PSEBH|nr:hypothetical protein [Pseudooceanicola batsensis]EAQ05157.1 hypothetical protein OB2597_07725 [Pseudooceanicola batsensis HTCC2597]